ncbi:MAG: HEAT repeat domain-containing protein [Acidobacteriota bacterium]|nr:HEAT repeat domain-containing protein [Acidobacteriota bacterium]
MLALITAALLTLLPPATLAQQEQTFTPVQGPTLQARQEAAVALAAGTHAERFWTAYSFDVRPGVVVDVDYVSDDGHIQIQGTWDTTDSGFLTSNPAMETRSLGVFALRDASGQVVRVEVYNLGRRREYGGYTVYWLGRATNEESLAFLRGLAESAKPERFSGRDGDLPAQAVRAIALHDDRRVPEVLTSIARASLSEGVRAQAIRSLGVPPVSQATRDYLAQLARDERESQEVRRAAVSAYGRSRDAQALSFLQSLYASLNSRDLRRVALTYIARNDDRKAAAQFLIKVATQTTDDPELRRLAIARLGEMAGEQALGTLRETVARTDADTQLQLQALVAIGRRPAAESVPLLINIAKTHPKPEVRRQAFLILGRTGDPAAVEFLKSVLTK